MSIPLADPRNRGLEVLDDISDADFAVIARCIHADTGIVINDTKRSLLVSRLSRRLRHLELPNFSAYARLIDSPAGENERLALVSAITTNVTGFFREPHHFSALAEMIPDLTARAKAGARVRIWSAGCSTGQEPYSIAATLLDRWPGVAQADVRILATDIDPEVIAHAQRGVFDRRLLGDQTHPILKRFIKDGPAPGQIEVAPALGALIRFEVLNLLGPWPFNGGFDVIFCRNVVIYFDAETRLQLWTRFAARILPGGTLFVGHSERIAPELDALFSPSGVTQYRRSAQPVQADGRGNIPATGLAPSLAKRKTTCP